MSSSRSMSRPRASSATRQKVLQFRSSSGIPSVPISQSPSTNLPSMPSRTTTLTQPCCICNESKRTYACVQCNGDFCAECWARQFPHRPGAVGIDGLPHEKTDRQIVDRLKHILEPIRTPEQQQSMHKSDEETIWFGVARDSANLPIFQDYGRYATIMAESQTGQNPRYPQLVSFVGQTAAGKSTIIKMLIDSKDPARTSSMDLAPFQSPVTGAINDNIPTSGDVHLYSDPATYSSSLPMLYADCEGLDGGENIPRASRSKPRERTRKNGHSSKRALAWASTEETQKRGYAVARLYPRLLYIFSDVVVFVLRNSKTFESVVLEKLLDWASASIEKSLNQPALPHAIIVLNASEIVAGIQQWDVDEATKILMSDIAGAINRVPRFGECADYWRERGKRINNMRDLLECYYSSITVVRIPTRGRYMLMDDQIGKLHHEIQRCCNLSHSTKRKVKLLASGEKLQIYLQSAFDHFSKNLDAPFDFVKEAIKINPIPRDFQGNILKLALAMKERDKTEDAPRIFQELSHMVASCIMLDVARQSRLGTARVLLEDYYLDHCDGALYDFCDTFWPCSFQSKHGRCQLVKSGHSTKPHQNAEAKIIGTGNYESSFSAEGYEDEWLENLVGNVEIIQRTLQDRTFQNPNIAELDVASRLHRERLTDFYSNIGGASSYMNNTTCFACLRELPEYPLPCGHILCISCIRAFGRQPTRTTLELPFCPLHTHETMWPEPWEIKVKPLYAGVRILNLDGGGVRGIVELEVLAAIEKALGGELPIQLFFDLIVGTSTGGIIALGLGAQDLPVQSCIEQFKSLCGQAFSLRPFHNIPLFGPIAMAVKKSKYRTKPFEAALKDTFGENALFGGQRNKRDESYKLKVAITATTNVDQQAVVFTNYNRLEPQHTQYRFERFDNPDLEMKTWEVARATSAAPPFFKVFRNHSRHGYLDGALYHNNPIWVAHHEYRVLWPDLSTQPPDLLLSIGTGHHGPDRRDEKEPKPVRNFFGHMIPNEDEAAHQSQKMNKKFPTFTEELWHIAASRFDNMLNCNKIWEQYRQDALEAYSEDRRRYIRINPDLRDEVPRLDDVSKLRTMQTTVQKEMKQNIKVKEVAHRLIASTFFFEKGSIRNSHCTGTICCRFTSGSPELKELGRFLEKHLTADFTPHFAIREIENHEATLKIPISEQCIGSMCIRGHFELEDINVDISRQFSVIMMSLCLQPAGYAYSAGPDFPISGFPRSLLAEDNLQRCPARGLVSRGPGSQSYRPHRRLGRPGRRMPRPSSPPIGYSSRRVKSQSNVRPVELGADPFRYYDTSSLYPERPEDVDGGLLVRSRSSDSRLLSTGYAQTTSSAVFELDSTPRGTSSDFTSHTVRPDWV